MLRQLDDEIWVVDHPFRTFGLQIGTRSSVIRLADGSLFLHSPGPLSVSLAKQMDELGPVRCIVAPNRFHHLFIAETARAYQAAGVYLAPGLAQKRRDLSYNGELADEPAPAWSADLDQICVRGAPWLNEVVFLHRRSRTLLLTDLVFNVEHSPSWVTRLFLRAAGAYGRLTSSRMLRLLVRDREAARESILRILEWDFERVIVTHGAIVEKAGRERLREGFDWLL